MNVSKFQSVINKMPKYMRDLKACKPIAMHPDPDWVRMRPNLPEKGIYALYEQGKPMYVGRSDRLPGRLLGHSQPGSASEKASFAFNIAVRDFAYLRDGEISAEELPNLGRDGLELLLNWINGSVSRSDLSKNDKFIPYFKEAKQRVRKMKVRVVEIEDPIEQTIFEVYALMELGTKFNSFENH